MSKVRKFMKKWQELFIWIVAIAFVGGIALWAFAVNYNPARGGLRRTINEATAYLTVSGEPLKSEQFWVFPEQIEERYGDILSMYGNPQLDNVFEVPYIKTLVLVDHLNERMLQYYAQVEALKLDRKKINEELNKRLEEIKKNTEQMTVIKSRYGSLTNYSKELRAQIERETLRNEAREKIAGLDDTVLKAEYEKAKNDLIDKYTKAQVKYVTFEKAEQAEQFAKLAKKKGFTEAASEMNLTPNDFTVTKGTYDEEVDKKLFEGKEKIVSAELYASFYVFNVLEVHRADTFENFKKNPEYQSWVDEVKGRRFAENFKKWREEKKLEFHINSSIYKAWYDALATEDNKLIDVYKRFYERFFDEKDQVKPDIPYEEKAAFIILADRVKASTDTALETVKPDVNAFEKKIVLSIYEQLGGSSREILRRMKEYYPDKKDVAFQYYSKLYDEIKPYLSVGGMFYVMQPLFEVYQGFAELAESTSLSKDMRADSLYKLYEINKLLDDATSAKQYLTKLKELAPDYKINFEQAERELEDMFKRLAEQESTPESTETSNDGTTGVDGPSESGNGDQNGLPPAPPGK